MYWQYDALQFLYNMWEFYTGSMVHYTSCIICRRWVLAVWCITVSWGLHCLPQTIIRLGEY